MAPNLRFAAPVHLTIVFFRNEGGVAMSTKVVVESSMVRIRRVLSVWLVALVVGLAAAAAAGPAEDLFAAAGRGDVAAVQALLRTDSTWWNPFAKRAEVNAKMSNGATALMTASQNGHLDVVQALLDKGADVNAKTSDGSTALSATAGGDADVRALLVQAGAKP